jgi:YesN/AraC family two-component response regulator
MSYVESGARKLNEFDILDSSRQQDEQALPVSSQTPQNNSEADEDRTIILVVEDNTDVREFIKDSLGKTFQIEEASNGEQGVRKAEQIIPDLIISDIMMPIMDGNELTRILKNDEKTSHVPIILLTAKSEQQSKLEGLETGADDYLTKPFDTKELQIRINNLISIRRKLQEKFSKVDFIPVKKSEKKKLSNLEEQFMYKVMEVIENHISEEEFSIEQFGKEVGMSRMQLHRKLKALSGKSASHYIRSVRLSKARRMIEEREGNISEIAYSVGFSSPQYFARCFKEEFGFPPSDLTT